MMPAHVQVAATLRRMREKARVTRDEAAVVLGCTSSKIGDLETGRSKPKPAELERLLDHYGIAGRDRDDLVEFARKSRTRRKPSPYTSAVIPATIRRAVDLESQATSTFYYSGELIPGLLQIPAYAGALLELGWAQQPDDVARRLELRSERAAALTRDHPPPLRYRCILGEAALRTNVGGTKVMREQIEHLVDLNRRLPNLVIQILPLGAGPHHFIGLTVTVHRFAPPAPDMMILEGFEREIIRDEPTEVARASRNLDHVSAMANSIESETIMERVLRELSQID